MTEKKMSQEDFDKIKNAINRALDRNYERGFYPVIMIYSNADGSNVSFTTGLDDEANKIHQSFLMSSLIRVLEAVQTAMGSIVMKESDPTDLDSMTWN